MSERDERVGALVEWLNEQGAAAGSSIHGWRCEYPDRYGECDCVAEMARDLLGSPAMRDLLAEERARALREAADDVERDGAVGLTRGPTTAWLRARADEETR